MAFETDESVLFMEVHHFHLSKHAYLGSVLLRRCPVYIITMATILQVECN